MDNIAVKASPNTQTTTQSPVTEMKYQLIALPALAATVAGQDLNSILNVLQTALPSSLVAEAITNSAAVESQISSQFAAGETPGWFSSLPTDVQSYLAPTDAAGSSSVSAAASSFVANNISSPITAAPTALGTGTLLNPNGTAAGGNATGMGRNSSMVSTGSLTASESATGTGSGSGSTGGAGSGSGSSDSAESSGSSSSDSGASLPTAAFGMGLAGAVGMIGVLAL